jgi:uncharacterized protein
MPKRSVALAGFLAFSLFSATPAMAQTPPADAMAAARELFVVMKMDDQYKAMMPLLLQALKPAIVQGRPQIERDFDALSPILLQGFESRLGEVTEAVAGIYARNFTAAELREVTAFYRGPTGQKFLQKLPSIMQEAMVMGQRIGNKLGDELKGRMIEELRKRGHNI